MTAGQKWMVGVVTGAAAVLAAAHAARAGRAISFRDRVVLITGGSRGLGLVLARGFAAEGARLVLLARDEGELDRARRLLEEEHHVEVMALRCDVRQKEEVRAACARVLDTWPGIDVLVNNAGIIQVGPLDHMQEADFENAMATHFWGPYHLTMAVVPSMRRRGFGRIVNISSIGGKVAVPHLGPYSASKFALTGLSDALRAELAPHGIHVTTVCPGLMRTGSPINADMKGQHEAEYAWFAISSALPGLTMSAERAARQIIDACRHGDPELTITTQARLLAMMNELAPAVVAHATTLAARLLPGATGPSGDESRPGRASGSKWAPSVLTTLADRAAVLNNEV